MGNIKRRSGIKIMAELIVLLKPLIIEMIFAITFGVIGFLFATGIGVLGGYALLNLIMPEQVVGLPFGSFFNFSTCIKFMFIFAIGRAILHYLEQYCNHLIAFKILQVLRHKIFRKMIELAPAKLDNKNEGDLIGMITNDIELLEVFYAHTVSPIVIAIITQSLILIYFFKIHYLLGIVAFLSYIIIGIIIPLIVSKKGKRGSMELREEISNVNSLFLDSISGIREILQFNKGSEKLEEISVKTKNIIRKQNKLNKDASNNSAWTDSIILIFNILIFLISMILFKNGSIQSGEVFISTLLLMTSFGPVVALANLGSVILGTLSSGERVLSLLEEEPETIDIRNENKVNYGDININNISFSYDEEKIFENFSLKLSKNKIIGIKGRSGSGKSTLLKLIMRFWKVNNGSIEINNENIEKTNTGSLREKIGYMTQDTVLFNGTLKDNLLIAKEDASDEELKLACEKASVYNFIMSLPEGFNTHIGELGDNISGGEKQRIGLARTFLSEKPIILLDEPTSNLDSLNEAIILKSLKKESKEKMVVLISHRDSTMGIVEEEFHMERGRIS